MANYVIAGDYPGWLIQPGGLKGDIVLKRGIKKIRINKETVESYEVVTDEHRKSAASGAVKGLIGGALLGPVGALAGGLSAKEKGTYQVAVQFKDDKKSLLKMDEKLYKLLIQVMF